MTLPTFNLPFRLPFDFAPLPPAKPPIPKGTPNKDNDRSFEYLLTMTSQARPHIAPALEQKWGIFDSAGNSIFDVDTVLSVTPASTAKILDFPVEKGGFATYNKVQTPLNCRVQLGVAGALRIKNFMAQLEAVGKDTNLYTVITPERSYANMNLEKWHFTRSVKDGQNLVKADLTFTEIRLVTVAFSTGTLKPANPKALKPTPATATELTPNQLISRGLDNTDKINDTPAGKAAFDDLVRIGNALANDPGKPLSETDMNFLKVTAIPGGTPLK